MLKGVHLTVLAGPVVPVPVPRLVLEALTEVEVSTGTGMPGGFKLTFSLTNHSILQSVFLVAATRTALMRVVLVATVNGLPSVLMDGVITDQQVGAGEQPGQSTLTILGEDISKLMDLQDLSGLSYPAMTADLQALAILGRYASFGIVPMVIPPIVLDVPIPVERIELHDGTDREHLDQSAARIGYVFYVDAGPVPGMNLAYWGPEIKVGVPQPALNLDLDAHRNVESLSFAYDSANTAQPVLLVQNALTKVPIPVPIPRFNPLQPPLAALAPPITRVTIRKDAAKLSAMQAAGEGLADAAKTMDAVTATGTLDVARYGRVLKARGLVGVRGAGIAFDGLYFVKRVTSTLKRGAFTQRFELTRNGLVSLTPVVAA